MGKILFCCLNFLDVPKTVYVSPIPASECWRNALSHTSAFSENFHRKDYTPSEKVAIVEAMRSFKHGGDRRSDRVRKCDDDAVTVDRAAKQVGLGGKDSYSRAKAVVEKGVPELVEAMDSGRLSLSAAAKLAEAQPDEQKECLEKHLDENRATASLIQKNLSRIRNRKERERLLEQAVSVHSKDDTIRILHCPFQQLEQVAGLEPETVDLICTDIPYVKEFVPELEALGRFAAHMLKPSGLFVTYCGQFWLHKAFDAFGKHLTYRWMNASCWEGDATPVQLGGWANPHARVLSKWKPILIYSKGDFTRKGQWCDVTKVLQKEKDWHPWQQPLDEVEREKKRQRAKPRPLTLTVRPCDGCTACCTCVAVAELRKGFYTPCSFCNGDGCTTYRNRPPSCSVYHCAYSAGFIRHRPDKCDTEPRFPPIGAGSIIG